MNKSPINGETEPCPPSRFILRPHPVPLTTILLYADRSYNIRYRFTNFWLWGFDRLFFLGPQDHLWWWWWSNHRGRNNYGLFWFCSSEVWWRMPLDFALVFIVLL